MKFNLLLILICTFFFGFPFVKPLSADVLMTRQPERIFHGRSLGESEDEIKFQIRFPDGQTKVETFAKAAVKSLVITIDGQKITTAESTKTDDLFQYCEELAFGASDLEVEFQLQRLLNGLSQRNLDEELRQAVERLRERFIEFDPNLISTQSNQLVEERRIGRKLAWKNRDWQARFVRRLPIEAQQTLHELLAGRRQSKPWQEDWNELKAKVESIVAKQELQQIELALSTDQDLDSRLLRLELLLEGAPAAELPMPVWPK